MSEQEVAETMRRSALFLSFGHPEGLCLANLEAMASGCKLIGYSGLGGREYFRDNIAREIPVGDIHAFVESVEQSVLEYDEDREKFLALSTASQCYVHETFSPEKEQRSLTNALRRLLPGVIDE